MPREVILGNPTNPTDYWNPAAVQLRKMNGVTDADMLKLWGLPEDFQIQKSPKIAKLPSDK